MRSLFLLLAVRPAAAGHCYSHGAQCESCVSDGSGSACGFCNGACQMAWDACATDQVTSPAGCPDYEYTPPPGEPFFEDVTSLLSTNPTQLNYGVAVTDTNGNGKLEFFVAGYGAANQAFEWDGAAYVDVAKGSATLQDASSKAIGVAACDVDGDGAEELYILNTDQYSGSTSTSDRLVARDGDAHVDLFSLAENQGSANFVAGRSCACVDRDGDGVYGVMVANYGGPMRLFEASGTTIRDAAPEAGVDKTTGGRALVSGPIVSHHMDIFANNEGWSGGGRRLQALSPGRRLGHRSNYLFVNQGDGTYTDEAAAAGVLDPNYTGRGTALLDANGDGLLDIVYGNWNANHRLFLQSRDGDGKVSFADAAPAAMAEPSPIRTVIVADFDNDGYEEIFWNNIPGENRLFRKLPTDGDWTQINAGAAVDASGYGTGAAVGDFDGDGVLELLVSHGESQAQPLSLFRPLLGAGNHWLRVAPTTASGAPARGAIVRLHAAGRTQLRVIDAGSGYLCQQEPVAHFGLGAETAVASIEVVWPGGVCTTLEAPTIDTLHAVEYPAGRTAADGCDGKGGNLAYADITPVSGPPPSASPSPPPSSSAPPSPSHPPARAPGAPRPSPAAVSPPPPPPVSPIDATEQARIQDLTGEAAEEVDVVLIAVPCAAAALVCIVVALCCMRYRKRSPARKFARQPSDLEVSSVPSSAQALGK